jgi:hypothetical protein
MKVYHGRIVQARGLRRQRLSVRQIADRLTADEQAVRVAVDDPLTLGSHHPKRCRRREILQVVPGTQGAAVLIASQDHAADVPIVLQFRQALLQTRGEFVAAGIAR